MQIDINIELYKAVHACSLDDIKDAVQRNADVNLRVGSSFIPILHIAAFYDRTGDVVAYLLSQQADATAIDNYNRTVLHSAIDAACPRAIRLLLTAGAPADVADNGGTTPLRSAILLSHLGAPILDIIGQLLQAGADPDKPDRHGVTPRQEATRQPHCDAILALFNASC